MRSVLFVPFVLILTGCHFSPASDHPVQTGKVQHQLRPAPGFHAIDPVKVRTLIDGALPFRLRSNLVNPQGLLYLGKADLTPSAIGNLDAITSSLNHSFGVGVNVYDITHHPAGIRYHRFAGRTVTINSLQGTSQPLRIRSVVLVDDPGMGRYYAGVLNGPPQQYPGWAGNSSRLEPFPFTEIHDPSLEMLAETFFDSLAEFHVFKEKFESGGVFRHRDIETRIFDARKGEKYVLVEHNWRSDSTRLCGNYSALYHVTPSGWALETEGRLPLPLVNLVDTDGDIYPELLLGDTTSVALYEINYQGFHAVNTLQWSPARPQLPEKAVMPIP